MRHNRRLQDLGKYTRKTLTSVYTKNQIDGFLKNCTKKEYSGLLGIENQLKKALKPARKEFSYLLSTGTALELASGFMFYKSIQDLYSSLGYSFPESKAHDMLDLFGSSGNSWLTGLLGIATAGLGMFLIGAATSEREKKERAIREIVYPYVYNLRDTVEKYSK
jgi:preprotein translocase subunit Sss1